MKLLYAYKNTQEPTNQPTNHRKHPMPILPDTIGVSFFASVKDNQPIERPDLPIDNLTRGLQVFRKRLRKSDVPCWSPTIYKPGTTRGKQNVEWLTALVLDYDDGTTMEAATEAWSMWHHIGHTSWSHTPEHHRFRIILPLREPVPADLWDLAWEGGIEVWRESTPGTEGGPDTKCKDASRIYYLPAQQGDREMAAWVTETRNPLNITPRPVGHPWWDRLRARLNPPIPERPKPVLICHTDIQREIRDQLAQCPGMRERWADQIGGTISAGTVKWIACPKCARRSVWYVIAPATKRSASCNHENSCGWFGPLWDLTG
jgi:hypothetical protein